MPILEDVTHDGKQHIAQQWDTRLELHNIRDGAAGFLCFHAAVMPPYAMHQRCGVLMKAAFPNFIEPQAMEVERQNTTQQQPT